MPKKKSDSTSASPPEDRMIQFPEVPPEDKGVRNLIEEQLDACLETVLIGLEYMDLENEDRANIVKVLIRILMVYSEGGIGHELTMRLIHELIDDPEVSKRRDWNNPLSWN